MSISAGAISVALEAAGYGKFSKVLASAAKDITSVQEAAKGIHAQTIGINKMASALEAAAGAAAGYAAVTKAFSLAQQAQETEAASKTFRALGGNIEDLRKATGGMISDAELVKKANLAETMGIPADAFKSLAQIAQASSAKTGQSMAFMFDSIVTGTARQSKMILDNLGIMINQEKAERSLAASKGKTVEMLTEAEKKQAFLNEVMTQGAAITQQVAQAGVSLSNPFGRFTAALDNASDALGSLLKNGFAVFFQAVTPALDAIGSFKDGVEKLSPWVKTLLGGLLALGGGLVTATAALAAGGEAFAFLKVTVGAATTTFKALVPVVSSAALPLLGIVAAIGAVVVGVAYLHKAWRLNWGGIQDKTAEALNWIQDNAKTALQNVVAALFYLKDAGVWAFSKLADLGVTVLVRGLGVLLDGVDVLTGALRGLLQLMGVAAKASGFDKLGKTLEGAAESLGMSTEGMRKTLTESETALAGKLQVAAPTWEGAKAQARAVDFSGLKTAVGGVADSLRGALTSVWDKAKAVGGDVAKEWRLILSEIGFFSEDDVKRVQKAGAVAGQEMSAALIKARESWRDMLRGMEARLQTAGLEGPQKGIREATLESEKQLADLAEKAKAAAIGAEAYGAAVQKAQALTAAQQAAAISGAAGLMEFSDALAFAKDESMRTGVALEKVTSNVRLTKLDTAGLLSGPVSDAADNLAKAFDIQLSGSDRAGVVKIISDNLANLLKGGRMDWASIGGAVGTVVAKTEVGGKLLAQLLGSLGGKGGLPAGAIMSTLGPVGAAVGAALVQAVQVVGPMLQEAADSILQGAKFVAEEIPQAMSDMAGQVIALFPEDRIQGALGQAFSPKAIQAAFLPSLVASVGAVGVSLAALSVPLELGKSAFMALVSLGPVGAILAASMMVTAQAMMPLMLNVSALAMAAGVAVVAVAGLGFVAAGLLGAFLKLSMETKSFKAFRDAFTTSVDRVVQALEPFWNRMSALAGLFDAFISVVIPLAAAFASNEVAARLLFYTLKGAAVGLAAGVFAVGVFVAVLAKGAEGLAMVMGAAVRAFENFVNGMNASATAVKQSAGAMLGGLVAAFGAFLSEDMRNALNAAALTLNPVGQRRQDPYTTGLGSAFDELANQARAISPDLQAMAKSIQDLTGLSYEEAIARAKALQAQKDATESLTNVPSGYKVALARFEALDATGAGGGGGAADLINQVVGRVGGAGATSTGAGSSSTSWGAGGPTQVSETAGWGVWTPPGVQGKATSGQPAGTNITITNMTVMANNADEFKESLAAAAKRDAFVRTGSSNDRGFRPFQGAGI